jgi:hypothetical protein
MATQLELPVADAIRDLSDYGSREEEQPHPPAVNPQLPDRSAAQPSSRAFRDIAAARLRAAAVHREERARLTPEQVADRMTSLMDARIALRVAVGNSLDDIDPSSGLSVSHSSYEATRHSWISSIRYHGFNEEYDREALNKALAFWTERRPQYLNEDDWLAAGMTAHREYWQGIGHGCGAPYCEMHGESSEGK